MRTLILYLLPISALGAISIVNTALPNPVLTHAVSGAVWTVTATGGTGPYTYAVTSGSLPTGLSLASGGVISGTTTAVGASTFTITATDSLSATGNAPFTITAQVQLGHGCTTATITDWDCDYYGVGSAIGMDADDNDATVNTPATVIAKYTTITNFLSTVKGYSPLNIWYLSTSGNDGTCVANSTSLPCLTWAHIAGVMGTGDMIMARAGTYLTVANYDMPSGNISHQNYAMAYPGEKAILDHSSGVWYGVEVTTYATIDGLVIQNTPCAGPTNTCAGGIGLNWSGPAQVNGMIVRNCEIRDYYRGIWGIASQANTVIERNVIHDDYGEHNIYLGNNVLDAAPQTSSITVQNNILYNASWDNFHHNGVCSGCLLDGNIMYSANVQSGGGSASIAFQNGWKSSTVQNNVVFNASAFVVNLNNYFDPSLCCVPAIQNNNLFVNNTFVYTGRDNSGQNLSNDGFGVFATTHDYIAGWVALTSYSAFSYILDPSAHVQYTTSGGIAGATTPTWNDSGGTTTDGTITWTDKGSQVFDQGHNTFTNNLFLDIGNPGTIDNVVQFWRQSSADADWLTTNTYTNNVIYGLQAGPLGDSVVTNGTLPTTRSFAYFASNAASFTGNTQSDPLLTAANVSWYSTPSLWNPRPGTGSPAIAAGTHTNAPSLDITGATRANPPSMGAFEISITVPPTPTTTIQNVTVRGFKIAEQ